jgi:hypothetical protein
MRTWLGSFDLIHASADHGLDHRGSAGRGHVSEQGCLAVAEDLHAVGDLRHFIQPVRDVDDRDALLA